MTKKLAKTDNSTPLEVEDGMRLESADSVNPDDLKPAEGLNPRKEQLDAIYAARARAIEKESNFGADLIKESAEPNPEPPVETPSDAASEVATVQSPAENKSTPPVQEQNIDISQSSSPEEEPLFTLKVDGVDLKLTKDQLIERAQKGIGAEKKFQEAAALRDEAKNLIYGQPLQPQAPVQQNSAQQYPKPAELDDSTVEDFLNKLNFGSKDEQKAAVKTLVSKAATIAPTAPQVPIDQIVNVVTQNVNAAVQSQQIMANLGNEFPDVFSDNLLSTAAGQLTNQLRDKYTQAGVPKSFVDISREALSTVRNKYIQKAPEIQSQQPSTNSPASAPVVVQMDDKIAAKRAAPKPVIAVNKTAPSEPTAPKLKAGQGKSDTVNWMREKRGQSSYN